MPISKRVARFNKRVTNPVTRHIASWMPGFAIVSHVGRRSGRVYRTPVNVFRDDDRYVFALTYGADSDWVRNVLAAGGCEIETRRRTIELRDPKRFTDPTRHLIPIPARWILRLVNVKDFMALSPATADARVARNADQGRQGPIDAGEGA
jgi:deazaflavin-dependent oxidoreductase (nitroreductase family)